MKYNELCPPHRRALISHAMRLTFSDSASEDLVQDTLLRAYTYWDQFQPTTDDPARDALMWLRRIMSNIFNSQCGKNKRIREGLDAYGDELSLSEGEVEEGLDIHKTRELIERLRPDYKDLIELHYINGLSYKELATELDIPMTKVQKRLWRARKELKELLTRAGVVSQASA